MLILLGLGVLWAAVLVPPILRSRATTAGPLTATNGGSAQLEVYHPSAFHRIASSPPRSVPAARRRRRDVLLVLVGGSVFTLLGGFAVGGFVPWTAHFMTDLALLGYIALLVQRQQPIHETSAIVVPMRSSMDHPGLAEAAAEVSEGAMVGGLVP